MVYVVERYLSGLSRADLLAGLARLEPVIEELRGEGAVVRHLGSTIVLGDEACFCEFDGPSEAAVAEANRRAALPFDRIVPALLVHPRLDERFRARRRVRYREVAALALARRSDHDLSVTRRFRASRKEDR